MRKNIVYSIIVHAVVLAFGYFGLPALRPDISPADVPITVEIVTVADQTNAARPQPEKAKPQPKKAKPKPKPKPEKKKAAAPPPPPPPSRPQPEVAAVSPPPPPKAKAKVKHKPEARKKAPPRLAKAKPRHKPRPPDAFASVLKTLEKMKERQPVKKKKKEDSFEKMIAKALITSRRRGDLSKPVTISEIDLVRRQIARCWNLPAGAKDAEDLIIEIKVFMNPDGTVNTADIKDKKRVVRDGFYRSAAESALRAVLNRRCQPFKLPPEKYNRWKTMTLVFNPKEMFR